MTWSMLEALEADWRAQMPDDERVPLICTRPGCPVEEFAGYDADGPEGISACPGHGSPVDVAVL